MMLRVTSTGRSLFCKRNSQQLWWTPHMWFHYGLPAQMSSVWVSGGTCCHFRLTCPFLSTWWPPQSSQRSSTQAKWMSLWWEEVKLCGCLSQDTECASSCATVSVGTIVASKSSQLLKGLTLGFHTTCCWVWKSGFRLTGDAYIRKRPVIRTNERFPFIRTVHKAWIRTCIEPNAAHLGHCQFKGQCLMKFMFYQCPWTHIYTSVLSYKMTLPTIKKHYATTNSSFLLSNI